MTATVAASLLGGGVAGALLLPTAATAQDTESDTPDGTEERQGPLATALQSLVDDGTLTQEQVDAITQAVQDARPERERGPRGGGRMLSTVADVLGMEASELREAIVDGQ